VLTPLAPRSFYTTKTQSGPPGCPDGLAVVVRIMELARIDEVIE